MTDRLRIEPLLEAEFEALLPMIAAYQGFYEADEVSTARNRDFFRRFIAPSEVGMLLGAWHNEELVGYACLYWHFSSTRAVETVLMNDLYVDPNCRGQQSGSLGRRRQPVDQGEERFPVRFRFFVCFIEARDDPAGSARLPLVEFLVAAQYLLNHLLATQVRFTDEDLEVIIRPLGLLEALLMPIQRRHKPLEGQGVSVERSTVQLHQLLAALHVALQPRRQSPSPHEGHFARPICTCGAHIEEIRHQLRHGCRTARAGSAVRRRRAL
jgi:Acetyltransferase (GNAT) family